MNLELQNQTLTQGDTWSWEESLTDYPADEYTLNLYLKLNSEATKKITATASGTDHAFAVTAAASGAYTPGLYSYQLTATKISDDSVTTLQRGNVEVEASLISVTDERSYLRQAKEAIEAKLATMAARDYGEISIAGRVIKYESKADLLNTYQRLTFLVKQEERDEKRRQGLAVGKAIKIQFG